MSKKDTPGDNAERFGMSLPNLAHLFIMSMAETFASDVLFFAPNFSYDLLKFGHKF